MRSALKGEVSEGLKTIVTVADQGLDPRRFHKQVVDHLRGVLLIKAGAEDALDYPQETLEAIRAASESCTLERALKAVQMFEQRPVSQDGFPTLPLEMALVETSIESEPAQPAPTTHTASSPVTNARPPFEGRPTSFSPTPS